MFKNKIDKCKLKLTSPLVLVANGLVLITPTKIIFLGSSCDCTLLKICLCVKTFLCVYKIRVLGKKWFPHQKHDKWCIFLTIKIL